VPEALSVTGFDGVPEAIRAGLTTIRQPVKEKGRMAGQLLLNRGDRTDPRSVILPTELIPGATSGPPPAADRWFSGL
jgi:DNA-binding LacI/PurR family transcriptional regulator